jgi:tetratricopeptide (TPR) repeat protein
LSDLLAKRHELNGERKDLEESIHLARQVVALTPADHTERAKCLNNLSNMLARWYLLTGETKDLEDGISFGRQAIQLTPNDHPNLAKYLGNLSEVLTSHFEQSGDDNLGILHKDKERLKEAEEMCMRALEKYEAAVGSKHTSTLNTVYNLGILYRDQGKLEAAEEMYLRALRGYKEVLGTKHGSTLGVIFDLRALYRDQGKLEAAEEIGLEIQANSKMSTMRIAVAGTGGLACLIAHYINEETTYAFVLLSRAVSP